MARRRDERRETRDEGEGRDERRETRDASPVSRLMSGSSHVSRLMSGATEERETLGGRIRRLRKARGMKQRVLATEAEVSVTQLCHVERNASKPSLRTLERIAEALGTTTGELLSASGDRRTRNEEDRGGDALASDALARGRREERVERRETGDEGEGRDERRETRDASHVSRLMSGASHVSRLMSGASPVSRLMSGAMQEPESGLLHAHDPQDLAVDRRVRARLAREVREWKKLERAAGVAGCATLPLFFPSAAGQGALLAREVRTAAGIGPAATVDPVALLESKGFRVLETKLPAGLDSWSLWDPEDGNAFVFLREAATPERKRFRAAFELGHLARFVSGGCRPLRDIGASRKTSRAFAAALLLPEEAVRETAHGLAIGPEDWTWELVLALKARFGVSAETFLYRIEELDLLSPARSRAFRAMLREHYARCRAAGRKDLEPAAPRNAGGRLGALRLRGSARRGAESETPLVPERRMR